MSRRGAMRRDARVRRTTKHHISWSTMKKRLANRLSDPASGTIRNFHRAGVIRVTYTNRGPTRNYVSSLALSSGFQNLAEPNWPCFYSLERCRATTMIKHVFCEHFVLLATLFELSSRSVSRNSRVPASVAWTNVCKFRVNGGRRGLGVGRGEGAVFFRNEPKPVSREEGGDSWEAGIVEQFETRAE